MLSAEMQRFLHTQGINFSKQKRLTQTLLPKEGYVTHIKNLMFYLNEGMIITRIRRGIKFYQSPWMREYIQINTLRRIGSRSKFEKDFFKLLVSRVRICFKKSLVGKFKIILAVSICYVTYDMVNHVAAMDLIGCYKRYWSSRSRNRFQIFLVIHRGMKSIIKVSRK